MHLIRYNPNNPNENKDEPRFAISKHDNSIYYIFYGDSFCIGLSFSRKYGYVTVDCTENYPDIKKFKELCQGGDVTKEQFVEALNKAFGDRGKELFFRLWKELFSFGNSEDNQDPSH